MVAFASTTLMHSAEPIDLAAVFRRTAELNASVLTGREAALQAHRQTDHFKKYAATTGNASSAPMIPPIAAPAPRPSSTATRDTFR